ncbi:MAG: thiamine pyrophosphate-dependent enzyme [Thermodesulfobacteriota bacterium]
MDALKAAPGYEAILPPEYRELITDGPYGRGLGVKDLGTFQELIGEHPLCAGCNLTTSFRLLLASLPCPEETIVVTCAGCFGVIHPQIALHCTIAPFGTQNAFASGLRRALRVRFPDKRKDVITIAGDGAFADIGFAPSFHSWFRGERFASFMLDNECYANTGGQASGMTPRGVALNMAPRGKDFAKIPFTELAKAAGCAYVATVTPAKPRRLETAVRRAILVAREVGPTLVRIACVCETNYKMTPIEAYRKAQEHASQVDEHLTEDARRYLEAVEGKASAAPAHPQPTPPL